MDWLSIYAASVSTIVAAWSIFSIWRDRSSVTVDILLGKLEQCRAFNRPAQLITGRNVDDLNTLGEGPPVVVVKARNVGRRPVHLSEGGLWFRDGTTFHFSGEIGNYTLPKKLDEGQSGNAWALLRQVRWQLNNTGRKLRVWVYCRSEAGRAYKSKVPKRIVKLLREGTPSDTHQLTGRK